MRTGAIFIIIFACFPKCNNYSKSDAEGYWRSQSTSKNVFALINGEYTNSGGEACPYRIKQGTLTIDCGGEVREYTLYVQDGNLLLVDDIGHRFSFKRITEEEFKRELEFDIVRELERFNKNQKRTCKDYNICAEE